MFYSVMGLVFNEYMTDNGGVVQKYVGPLHDLIRMETDNNVIYQCRVFNSVEEQYVDCMTCNNIVIIEGVEYTLVNGKIEIPKVNP